MKEKILILKSGKTQYPLKQCGETMTAGELIEFLKKFDEDTPIYISDDKGDTFSPMAKGDFCTMEEF